MKLWPENEPETPSSDSRPAAGGDGDGRVTFDALVVSRDAGLRNIVSAVLQERGHRVSACKNLWTTGISVSQTPPSVAIVDWDLPQERALEVATMARRDNPHCHVLAVTGISDWDALHSILDSGADDVIVAPLSEERLELRIRVIERSAAERLRLQVMKDSLSKEHERLLIAVRAEREGVMDWDLQTGEIDFSRQWKRMLGYEEHDFANQLDAWYDLVHENDVEQLRQVIEAFIRGDLHSLEHTYRILHKDGVIRHMVVRGEAVRKPGGKALRVVGRQADITGEEDFVRDASAHLLLDPLTRLASRAVLMERLRQAISRASRRNGKPFAVLFFDLDRFKIINDGLGHLAGDKLLCAIADRLRTICRPSDTVCRFGGDEFVVVAEEVEAIRNATSIAERLHEVFQKPFDLDGSEVYASVSTGIVMWMPTYTNPEELLRDADNAMYRAKALGRNRYVVFDEQMHAEVVATLALENDLRRAISRDEFRAFYQPIVILETGQIAGFEVLARWQHPERGLLLPGEFIQLSEDMGVAPQIDRLVAAKACDQLRSWQVQFRAEPPLFMSVNMSTTQFFQSDLVTKIDQILRQSGVYGSSLKIEVTESILMENAEHASAMLKQLRALDIGISIDDFGTGYSSLAYLRRFEIDTLKIDYSFVSRMVEDEDSREIVRTIADLSKNLGKETIAEGVETRSQLELLRELDVERVQGFYISPPIPAEDTEKLLKLVFGTDNHLDTILEDRLQYGPRS